MQTGHSMGTAPAEQTPTASLRDGDLVAVWLVRRSVAVGRPRVDRVVSRKNSWRRPHNLPIWTLASSFIKETASRSLPHLPETWARLAGRPRGGWDQANLPKPPKRASARCGAGLELDRPRERTRPRARPIPAR